MTIDEALAPAVGSVAGAVTDGTNPIGGVSVTAINVTTNSTAAATTTAGDGTYSFAQLPEAGYVFRFSASGFGLRYNNAAATQAAAPVIDVAANASVTGVDAVLGVQATITGHVTGGTTPLPGMAVIAYSASTVEPVSLVLTAADGGFTLNGLDAGGYYIQVKDPNSRYGSVVLQSAQARSA